MLHAGIRSTRARSQEPTKTAGVHAAKAALQKIEDLPLTPSGNRDVRAAAAILKSAIKPNCKDADGMMMALADYIMVGMDGATTDIGEWEPFEHIG
jgi:hypothetical protein